MLLSMQRDDLPKNLPDTPGVYLFRGPRREILYIGKATSLRDRVRSYFASNLIEARSPVIAAMVGKARSLSWQETDSVLEALILEANLIKKHQPPYNTDEKDNTSFNYLVFTKEPFPRILVVRGRELFGQWNDCDIRNIFGPFPRGTALKEALKIVRKIFPFRDACTPGIGKPCFNAQIGLCPGVCSGALHRREYASTVRYLELFFAGKKPALAHSLEREMRAAVKGEKFEKATILRRQIVALRHIRDVALIKNDNRVSVGGAARVEAFDVAHTAGIETVGVMTVVSGGEIQKSEYRKFAVRSAGNDDIAALREILSRRLLHPEWALPRVIVVDGGKAQVRAAEGVLAKAGVSIPVVGVVKDEFHRPKGLIGSERALQAYEKDILLANSEAHRFAINWHRKKLGKRMLY